jgi:hypothetical protein
MDDTTARELLRLLALYVEESGSDPGLLVADVAEDVAMSLDVTTDDDDARRRLVERLVGPR